MDQELKFINKKMVNEGIWLSNSTHQLVSVLPRLLL